MLTVLEAKAMPLRFELQWFVEDYQIVQNHKTTQNLQMFICLTGSQLAAARARSVFSFAACMRSAMVMCSNMMFDSEHRPLYLPQSSPVSRLTAGCFGFLQCRERLTAPSLPCQGSAAAVAGPAQCRSWQGRLISARPSPHST